MCRGLVPVILLLTACPAADDDGPAPTDPVETGTVPGDDDDDADTGTLPTDPSAPGLRGSLVGADGEALAHYAVMACSTSFCLNASSDAEGGFVFQVDPGTPIAFKTHEVLSHPARAAALTPLVVADGPAIDLGTVYVPDLPEGVALGSEALDPQVLAVGDGLELTLNAADLVAPFGVFLHEIGAARLPDVHVPDYAALQGEQVLHVYAMAPFSTTSTSPIGLRVPTDLPSGSVAHARSIDYLDGTFSAPVALVSDGAFLVTAPGEGVSNLTHLVISAP